MTARKTALVICPGRGAYQADELGYLARHHADKKDFIDRLDAFRERAGQTPISELDSADRFVLSRHTNGENASLLISACALADFKSIDRSAYDIVAVAGNSMGWYLTLACAGALSGADWPILINGMGTLMHEKGVGGQILYPIVDEDWRPDENRQTIVDDALAAARQAGHEAYLSIRLGGTAVLAGDDGALDDFQKNLPADGRYPMRLSFHAAFHTPLLQGLLDDARERVPQSLFGQPALPMIDGAGRLWMPGASDIDALYAYTLGTQITQTYDFSKSVEVGLKEFAPDCIIILGPGATMGPPVAQTAISIGWWGLTGKEAFKDRQANDPIVLAMGLDSQRPLVTGQ